jgi:hypothetical protein
MPDHLEATGTVFEDLGDVLADLAHKAATWAASIRRLMNDFGARRLSWQVPASFGRQSVRIFFRGQRTRCGLRSSCF